MLLPPDESTVLTNMALSQGWNKEKELTLYHTLERKPFRVMSMFTEGTLPHKKVPSEQVAIFEADGKTHTLAFRQLLQEFYLNF